MPSWSGLHIGGRSLPGIRRAHQARSDTSSGSRFLAKSRSDFKLNFNVFLVIIGGASLCVCDLSHFTNFVG